MSLTLRLTGTGGAQLVPVFGCDCAACRRARREESHRRRPCSGVVTFNSAVTLLDAGRPDLMEHHPAGSFQQVLLTHYHLDHVQGLFPLRWGVGASIPVPTDINKKESQVEFCFKMAVWLIFSWG